jgi:hypothetical protein
MEVFFYNTPAHYYSKVFSYFSEHSTPQSSPWIMKTFLFILSFHFFSVSLFSQYLWDGGIKLGGSNYLGDIGGGAGTRRDFVPDMKMQETKMSAGAFARYKCYPTISVLLSYNYGRIAGDDKLSSNPGRHYRNLSFRNDIHELALEGQWYFYTVDDLGHSYTYRTAFRAYFGLGVAGFYHNPLAYYQGQWYALRPLRTEGESKPYATYCVAIPVSMGFYFTFKRSWRLGWDIDCRTTFTDYLDDVSGRYASPSQLSSPLAIALANRTGELHPSTAMAANYTPGNKRGDPAHNDSYIFTTINASYVFRGRWYRRGYNGSHGRVNRHRRKHVRMRF